MSQRDSGYARKSDRIIDRYWIGMIESYKARYPTITDLIRRGYSAERIAELADCEVWVPKMIKYSGRF